MARLNDIKIDASAEICAFINYGGFSEPVEGCEPYEVMMPIIAGYDQALEEKMKAWKKADCNEVLIYFEKRMGE